MQTIELEGDSVRITGALDFDRSTTGISPRRLPSWTRTQITDLMTAAVVGLPSGVRLEFVTDANEIELHVQTITTVFGDGPVPKAVFDLVIDGVLVEHQIAVGGNRLIVNPANNAFSMQRNTPPVLRFKKLGSKLKRIELWLPANANVELRALRISNGASIAPTPPSARRRWIHHGSSISHCFEADAPDGYMAGRRGAAREHRCDEPGIRRKLPPRSVHGAHNSRSSRRCDQSQSGDQRRERRDTQRANVRPGTSRFSGYRA